MTLQSVLSFINISPGTAGDQFVNQVQSIIASIYGSSPTMRSALDIRVTSGIPLRIEYEPGSMVAYREVGDVVVDVVQIDPNHADQYLSINQLGNVLPRGFAHMFVHELCHALFGTVDPSLDDLNMPGFDFIGENVRLENLVLNEMGVSDLRVGYFATFDGGADYLSSYTGGATIDYAFKNELGFAYVDASQSMQKNENGLLIGSATGEALTGGNGNDYLWGLDGADILAGGGGNDTLIGGSGSDVLNGLGDDDFIFFDAADGANVFGGSGRDVAVALGSEGVTVDMATQGLECVIGCDGADTITIAGAEDVLFAAGGGGADTFEMVWGAEEEGPRVMWGGAGADKYVFGEGMNGGIAVVNIAGLTEEMFSTLTLADLGLGSLNLNLFRAIIINPDESDRVMIGGQVFSASGVVGGEYRTATSSLQTAELGRSLAVQGFYIDGYMDDVRPWFEWDEMENILSISYFTGAWDGSGDPIMDVDEYDPLDQADQDDAMELYEYYSINPYEVWIEPSLHPDYNPMGAAEIFVVGGQFSGASLSENGSLTATAPDDSGTSPFDWLLVA